MPELTSGELCARGLRPFSTPRTNVSSPRPRPHLQYRWLLTGTASTWFLIDMTFYGQSLMNTTVVYVSAERRNLETLRQR